MKSLKFYLISASALLIVYLVAEYNRPTPVNWAESYLNSDKIPYGTYVLYHQLPDIFPGAEIQSYKEPIYNQFDENKIEHGTLLIISKSVNLNEYDFDKLKEFMQKGNNVFIAAESFGPYFIKQLKLETNPQFSLQKQTRGLRFVNKTQDTSRVYAMDPHMSDYYFDNVDTAKAIVLGKDTRSNVNFIKYTFGKGTLYLNANPLMSTNYSVLKTEGASYAAAALSYLYKTKRVLWNEYYSLGDDDNQSPMRVFLHNPALRMAYYIALFGLAVFVLYEIKRRQRIIPVIEPLKNSTLDFVNVVGQVYYEQRNNSNIAQKKAAYFLEYLRTKFSLKTSVINNEFAEVLAHKSGVDAKLISELLYQITLTRNGGPVSDQELINFNKNIEQFYLRSR